MTALNSQVLYTGDGNTTGFSIPFSFLDPTHIKAFIDNVETTAFTISTSTLTFNSAPANLAVIKISRNTPINARLVDFTDGSVLTEADLDKSADQNFFIAQETADDQANNMRIDNDDKFNAQSKVIKNVADPTNPQDATTKNYLENTWLTSANKASLLNLNANIANVNAVNNNSTNINTVAGNNANVTTVASNIGSVNTVATNINDVISVANDLAEAVSEIDTVANDLNESVSEIDTVANSITNVDTVGNAIANVNTVATDIANVNTVSGSISNVNTVAGINANVTTVAGISSDVTSVAGISSDVTAVNANSTNINAVNANATNINAVNANSANINTVAGNNANVTTVAGINADVTAVAGDATDIGTVATDLAGSDTIGTVAGSIANVNTVSSNIANVNSVASNETNINAVNSNSSNINTVAGNNANITTVAGISSDVTTVANDGTDIGTVATNIASVNTVAGNNTNINTVAGISSNVTTVANDGTDIGTVATDIANVNTVAGSIANVNTVASNVTGVNSFADRYRVASSDPSTSLDAGDLVFNTSSNKLKAYTGSAWQEVALADSASIKTLYENNSNTNAFTDAEQTKLSGIATSATANPDTDSLSEGSTNQYFTQARARGSISVSGDLSYNSSTGVLSTTGLASSTTDDLSEGSTNLYYTDARVDARLSGGSLPSITTTGNAVIGGNLTVSGTTTTVNTETIELADNKILLNSNATGSPTENGGIEISRGSSSNKTFQWDESTDKWTIGSETFVAGTVEGNLTGNVTGNVTGQTSDISNHSTDALSEGSSNLYFTNARATSAITGSNLDMGSNDITTTGKIKFANMYAQLSDLPSATTYHGMFAHVHATGKGYYAHGGNWIELANASDVTNVSNNIPTSTSALAEGSNLYFTDERVDDRVNNLLQAGTNINLAYDDNANTLTISSTGSSTTASPEVYGFNYTVGTGILQVTTTNGGQDNISSSTYATFDDVVYASTGFTWSITTTGELRATI